MEVVAVNIGEKRSVQWKHKTVETGIFKYPVSGSIVLGKEDVENDHVIDRKYHGGVDKACYLYPADVYGFWKDQYPGLDWSWGMFGENITVHGLDESLINIGSTYSIGSAIVEVSEPRQPCFKLGIRFGNQKVLKDFIQYGHPGVYVRVVQPGKVTAGDLMQLVCKGSEVSIRDVFQLLYGLHQDPSMLEKALAVPSLAASARRNLKERSGIR